LFLVDNGRLCMVYDHNITNDTIGPFAIGEWSMSVPVHYYSAVVPWFTQHRGQFSLLVHPNTGCEYEGKIPSII
jgi:aromatic ring-cleaving dioxygenase